MYLKDIKLRKSYGICTEPQNVRASEKMKQQQITWKIKGKAKPTMK